MSRALIRSVAAVVVAVSVLGAFVQSVVASVGSPDLAPAAIHDGDADPSPTPSPIATPTPAPEPSPTPTAVATPTPFDEWVAQMTALSIIDEDGDAGTHDDRHPFDGPWHFAADFGDAEVLSEDPTSYGGSPASWLIRYTEGLQFILIDDWPPELTLLQVECDATNDTVTWVRDFNIVDAVLSGSGPLSFDCLFIHSPVDVAPGTQVSARVVAHPQQPLPGDPTEQGVGLFLPAEFVADFGSAEVVAAQPVADLEYLEASWSITYASDTPVVLTELVPDGYELQWVVCDRAVDGPDGLSFDEVPVERDGNSVSFMAGIVVADMVEFMCTFRNVPAGSDFPTTLPATDTMAGSTVDGSQSPEPGRFALLLLVITAALSVAALRVRRHIGGLGFDRPTG